RRFFRDRRQREARRGHGQCQQKQARTGAQYHRIPPGITGAWQNLPVLGIIRPVEGRKATQNRPRPRRTKSASTFGPGGRSLSRHMKVLTYLRSSAATVRQLDNDFSWVVAQEDCVLRSRSRETLVRFPSKTKLSRVRLLTPFPAAAPATARRLASVS